MTRFFRRYLTAILVLTATSGWVNTEVLGESPAAREGSARPHMTLVVCDKSDLETEILVAGQRRTIQILDQAGIDIDWINVDCDPAKRLDLSARDGSALTSMSSYFMMVILPQSPKQWISHAMGLAAVQAGPYPRAYVFYDLVKAFSESFGHEPAGKSAIGMVLGCVIGHELGQAFYANVASSLKKRKNVFP
jgi:hypothetical protein